MILSDREIRIAQDRGDIRITPFPEDERRWSPTTVDLLLDAEIRPWEELPGSPEEMTIDPMEEGFDTAALIAKYTEPKDCGKGFLLLPKQFVLGWTLEKIHLHPAARVAARVEGKSSLARIGVGIHVTAPIIHPGFGYDEEKPQAGSAIRLEIFNVGPLTIRLTKGMAICQLLLERVEGTPEETYEGQYRLQGPPPRRERKEKGGSPRKRNK
jgi:dCTP deaminase